MVGPLNVKPPKPLPPDLETFVNSSEWQGFIVACFGTNLVSILPKEEVDMLALAFGKLKQHVVWKLKGDCSYLSFRNTVTINSTA